DGRLREIYAPPATPSIALYACPHPNAFPQAEGISAQARKFRMSDQRHSGISISHSPNGSPVERLVQRFWLPIEATALPRSPRNQHPARRIRYSATVAPNRERVPE